MLEGMGHPVTRDSLERIGINYDFDFQREDIRTILLSRGIHNSTGEISNLSEKFLLRFYALHKRHVPQIKALFEKRGGVRLHLDGKPVRQVAKLCLWEKKGRPELLWMLKSSPRKAKNT